MSFEKVLLQATGQQNKKPSGNKIQPGSAKSLVQAIDHHLLQRNAPGRKQTSGFHPSWTQSCPRFWYLVFEGAESKPRIDARLYRIFDNGHAVHDRLYTYFEGMGILTEKEFPLSLVNPVPLTGTCDGIIDWNGLKLIELKSINDMGFNMRKFYNKPIEHHYEQAQLYLYALKLDKGFIIYESKDTQAILIFEIERDDKAIQKVFRRMKKWYKNIESGTLPPRPYTRDSKQCSGCELNEYCWEILSD